ncbi:MAG TPA: glycosyltransferase [Xanthobacteraceae bacterium]|nr:glycosyltransferase [Xanthobacteraceae bacterium]
MRIGIIGKFPPIQGGVSMRTYWIAHRLAARGHEVHVVTNAKEAESPFRMHMRAEDWDRCGGQYPGGSVTVHWTDPVDRSQSYIPMASPFVSKLAGLTARVHAQHPLDVILSFYMEPYGIAGHLAAQMTGVPHVVRMAGSDAGRLWSHPQFEALYDHVLRSADAAILSRRLAERANSRGVRRDHIAADEPFVLPEELFRPDGPKLDLAAVTSEATSDPQTRDLVWGGFAGERPYFGVYGKLGETKGSFALLDAMHRLTRSGIDVGLVALAHGTKSVEERFRARVQELGLVDRVLQLPFLPHWRVPEFLRGCLAVCCLEQGFPIALHRPIVALEVRLCGTCLVASTEVLLKQPDSFQLANGYDCVAIEDVNRIDVLSDRLTAIAREPELAAAVGARGRKFASKIQTESSFPKRLEHVLEKAAARQKQPPRVRALAKARPDPRARFSKTYCAMLLIDDAPPSERTIETAQARAVLSTLKERISSGEAHLRSLAIQTEVEVAIATAQDEGGDRSMSTSDSLFRLSSSKWAIRDTDLLDLCPTLHPDARLIAFDYYDSELLGLGIPDELRKRPGPPRSYVLVWVGPPEERGDPTLLDDRIGRILELSDGSRTVSGILTQLPSDGIPEDPEWPGDRAAVEWLFAVGLLSLSETRLRSREPEPEPVGEQVPHHHGSP